MAKQFAGILGFLGLAVQIARGLVHGTDGATALQWGCVCMAAMAVIGGLLGAIAQQTVDESVRARFRAEVEGHNAPGEVSPT